MVTLFLPWLVEASAWSYSLLLGDLGLLHSDRLAKIRRSAKVVWVTVGPNEGGLLRGGGGNQGSEWDLLNSL